MQTPDEGTSSNDGQVVVKAKNKNDIVVQKEVVVFENVAQNIVIKGVTKEKESELGVHILQSSSGGDLPKCVSGVKKMTLQQIIELTNKSEEVIIIEKSPAERGEHVINNNVLKLFKTVVREFVHKAYNKSYDELVQSGKITPDMTVYQACENPLSEQYKTAVGTELVAHMQHLLVYIDANASAYGIRIEYLKNAMVFYLQILLAGLRDYDNIKLIPPLERSIAPIVEEFIVRRYFVDEQALSLWIDRNGGTMERFEEVNAEVVRMFRRLERHYNDGETTQWVKDIMTAIGY